jgi:hypothetical protein
MAATVAMKKGFNLELKGYETFMKMLRKGEYNKIFRMNLRKENKKLAVLGAGRLAREIRTGEHAANSPLTIWLKKSTKPLVNHADLLNSVSGKVGSRWYSFAVGVIRRTPSGNNLAHMLETGFTIKVTDKMRALFWYWSKESGGKFKALSKSTTAIRVKPRPYMKQAFFIDITFQTLVQEKWKNAVHLTFLHFKKKGEAEPWR